MKRISGVQQHQRACKNERKGEQTVPEDRNILLASSHPSEVGSSEKPIPNLGYFLTSLICSAITSQITTCLRERWNRLSESKAMGSDRGTQVTSSGEDGLSDLFLILAAKLSLAMQFLLQQPQVNAMIVIFWAGPEKPCEDYLAEHVSSRLRRSDIQVV